MRLWAVFLLWVFAQVFSALLDAIFGSVPDDGLPVGIVMMFILEWLITTALRIYFLFVIWAYCREGQLD